MNSKPVFLILDGNALLHRAWHALPQTMTTSDGTVVNAVYGFTNIVERMLETLKPDYMAVAWDLPGETFRHKNYPEYKATRVKKEQELYDQIPIIQDVLDGFGIPSLSSKGYEADDVIATIAKQNEKKNFKTLIVTGDQDSLQLVNKDTHGVYFVKGISETKLYDEKAVRERYGFSPEQLIDYKALAGDSSDNIPGVAGIGEKSAKDLIAEFGSVEKIFEAVDKHPDKIKPALLKKLDGQKEHALKMKFLVTLVHDVKLSGYKTPDAKLKKPDAEKLVPLFQKLEFRKLLTKYGGKDDGKRKIAIGEAKSGQKKTKQVELDELGDELTILIESQTEDLFGGKIKSMTLTDQKAVYQKEHPTNHDLQAVIKKLSKAKQLICYDLKSLMHTLFDPSTIYHLPSTTFDILIAAYLLNPSGRGYELPLLVQQYLHKSRYDISDLSDLSDLLMKEIKKEELTEVFQKIEMPLIPVLYQMESDGIKVDTDFLKTLSKKLNSDLEELTKKIIKLAGREFNVNSPSQLADILFEDLDIPTQGIKRTKTGYSTAADELEKIIDQHEIVPMIMEHRELAKLISTYVDALPNLVAKDGRIHTSYNQTVTSTGRLSSSNPNLQNIPVRTEQGREIRKAFVADSGCVLLSADYSQIELRIAALISGDKPFMKAFQEGADIHTRTASEVWDVPEDKVTKEQRYAAKAVNFGVLYGMGPRHLARSTGLTMTEAKAFIEKYFQIHHAIKDYIEETKAKAHSVGFVETLFGRKRYFPEIHSGVQMLVAQAERMAVNMPLQGSQADLIKLAMREVFEWLQEHKIKAKLLLQVHDELVLEVKKEDLNTVAKKVKEIMEGAVSWQVPIVAEVKSGTNWGEMNPL